VTAETAVLRISRLIEEAVRSGRFASEREVMSKAGLSPSYLSERRNALKKPAAPGKRKPKVSVGAEKARAIAGILGVSIHDLLGEPDPREQPLVDVYPHRSWAVKAARDLDLPEAAIQVVLRLDPGRDLPKMAWFHRIEAEAENLRPAAEPRR
jgi:hypothetical protein